MSQRVLEVDDILVVYESGSSGILIPGYYFVIGEDGSSAVLLDRWHTSKQYKAKRPHITKNLDIFPGGKFMKIIRCK
jgi:hypothetical protein